MTNEVGFHDLLRLIDERSTAFRLALASAHSLDVQVPTCPEWTLFDLAQHLGDGRRSWAATIAAGPVATAKSKTDGAPPAPRDREGLLTWSAESTQALLDALRAAGPDRGCWTSWADSQSPQTCGAVARHQLQEIAVHTYDAQLAVGDPQPLPTEVALDGVEEFLFTCNATTVAWPHPPAAIDYRSTEGRSWRLSLSSKGARVARLAGPAQAKPAAVAYATIAATANELVLAMYGRIPADALELGGDQEVIGQLVGWDPSE